MITTLRHLLVDSWAGRAAAMLIFLAFIGWGVGDMYSSIGSTGAGAITTVGHRNVTPEDLSRALTAQLAQMAQQMGLPDASHVPQSAREQAARQALQELITQNELQVAAERAGMVVPDDVVRAEIFSIPAFHNASGQFDRALFNQRIARIGMTEARLIQMMREDIITRSLLQGMGQSVQVPASLTERLLDFDTRERILDAVRIAPVALSSVPAPTEAQLHRYYDNHPWDFRTPEYRHAKIVLMTVDTVAKSIEVPESVLKQVYTAETRKYDVPETRTLEVLTFTDQARAQSAVTAWKNGMPWADLQKQYPEAAAVSLADIRQTDIPSPELAQAAFAAQANQVTGPVKSPAGWITFEITAITPPHKTSFENARADITQQIQKEEAPAALQARQKQFQDAVAGSTDLEHIPANIGAVPLAGTLDAQGVTREGLQAPIPGSDALRKAVFARVFSQAKNAQPVAVSGPDGSAFAVLVDDIEPGARKPFDSVRNAVAMAWQTEQARKIANERATALFTAAKAGSLSKAVAGQPEEAPLMRNVALSRVRPVQTLPEEIVRTAFATAIGKTAMVDTPDGFWLVNVTAEKDASSGQDGKQLMSQLQSQYLQSLQSDIPVGLNAALEKETPPTPINMALFNQVVAASAPAGSQP